MKRNVLHSDLRVKFSEARSYGCEKGIDKYKNIWFVIPKPLPLDGIEPSRSTQKRYFESVARAQFILGKLRPFNEMDQRDRLVSYLFTRKEAMLSSSIEGTYTTIDEALLTSGAAAEEEEKSASTSVRSYASCLERIFNSIEELGFDAVSKSMLQEMHRKIMEKDPSFSGTPGGFRNQSKTTVYIGGGGKVDQSIYNPAPFQHVEWLIDNLIKWLTSPEIIEDGDQGQMPIVVRMALAHSYFEAVHPFSDGNGRVGRMLWPVQMMLSNVSPVYLSGYISKNKEEYYEALQHSQQRLNHVPLIELMSFALEESYNYMIDTNNALEALSNNWKQQSKFRKHSGAERLLEVILGQPILTVKVAQDRLGITKQAANEAIRKLLEAKILTERTGWKRNRVFGSKEVVSLISRNF